MKSNVKDGSGKTVTQRIAELDPRVVAHRAAMDRLPDWVRQAWDEYSANPSAYPFGFSYHFPWAWNWKSTDPVTPPEPSSAGGATRTGVSPPGEPAVDEVDPPW